MSIVRQTRWLSFAAGLGAASAYYIVQKARRDSASAWRIPLAPCPRRALLQHAVSDLHLGPFAARDMAED